VWELAENAASRVSYEKGACPFLDTLLERTINLYVASNLSDQDTTDIIAGIRKVAAHLLKGKSV
jgi:hypothetical protein